MVTRLPPLRDLAAAVDEPAHDRDQLATAWLASLVLHALVIALLLGLWRWQPPLDETPIEIAFVPGNGAAGSQGGSGGGAEPGPAREGNAESSSAAPPLDSTALPVTVAAAPEPQPQHAAESQTTIDPPPQPTEPSLPASPPHKPAPPAKPAPAPRPPQYSASAQTASAPTPAPAPGTPGAGAGAGGTDGRGTGTAGAGRAAMGSGDLRAVGDDYLDRLRRHVRRFMTYPQPAKQQKQQGEVLVTVLLRRDGTVLDARIAQSSGYPLLDDAAIKAVRDSSKVPPFPENFPQREGTIDLPFVFRIGFLDRVFN